MYILYIYMCVNIYIYMYVYERRRLDIRSSSPVGNYEPVTAAKKQQNK